MDDEAEFEVWPENWGTAQLWLTVSRKWAHRPMGGLLGLDWHFVELELRYGGWEIEPKMWHGLQLMESAALPIIDPPRDGR